jgi:Protein of unknown function (DUF3040)
MSLAPAEQRALDKIEDALRRSDQRLAHMMTRFRLPLSRGGLVIFLCRLRRLRRLIVSAVAVAAAVFLVVVVIRSPAPPRCSAPRTSGSVAAAAAARNCPLFMREGRAVSTMGTGTAGAPGDRAGP